MDGTGRGEWRRKKSESLVLPDWEGKKSYERCAAAAAASTFRRDLGRAGMDGQLPFSGGKEIPLNPGYNSRVGPKKERTLDMFPTQEMNAGGFRTFSRLAPRSAAAISPAG